MALDLNYLRVYALGLAHHAVHDIGRDHFRQLRNYVDMCAFLASDDGRKNFFDPAQTVLEKTDNLYYSLIQRLLATVSEDNICTTGINLGIDALTYGAAQLKAEAKATGQPVTWLTTAPEAVAATPAFAQRVNEGECAGQFLWLIRSSAAYESTVRLCEAHPKSNFILVMPPEAVTPEAIEAFAGCLNLVLVLALPAPELSDTAHAAVEALKGAKLFYGLTVPLTDATLDEANSDAWLGLLAQDALFCVYTHKELSPALAEENYRRLCHLRSTIGTSALLLDWENDTVQISRFIAPQARVESLYDGMDGAQEALE